MDEWGQIRGVNLGGLLDARDGVFPGWPLLPEHLDLIAGAGFDTVRLPVRWWGHEPGALDETARSVVDLAVERDLSVVLSMHHADGLMTGEPGAAQRLIQLWERISQEYAGVPHLAFDLLNEPRDALTPGEWNQLLPQALAAVRAQDATRTVIVGGARMNSVEGLLELVVPEDPHLVLSVHYYEPFAFTHQGAFWEKGADAWVGTRWPGEPGHAARLAVTQDLTRAAERARELGHRLVVGEFGAYERAPQADRVAWAGWVRAECERLGLGWIFWDFTTDFGVFDREAGAWREDLRSALLPQEGVRSGL
ncbi:glycoside hydrolase family 5 protein [Kineosporia sp. NBRC 101731]|uniref:glycoside hydrolase family 5 protein n=1 Tax=Kineosporia sp. NBRC 101731 TaxID=3032199 RepID=UPI0024A5C2CA|nr:glycoside hydrolase family 5 protein [Kineosporia sp. NBRC 101731]GLY32200.1 hypothetical protein Kisp02_55650 [Kineosporia sp. NBRC 101731]